MEIPLYFVCLEGPLDLSISLLGILYKLLKPLGTKSKSMIVVWKIFVFHILLGMEKNILYYLNGKDQFMPYDSIQDEKIRDKVCEKDMS